MTEDRQKKIQSLAFIISVFIAVSVSLGIISNLKSTSRQCLTEVDDNINPNNASIESLIRLPGLGISRAEAIVSYRKRFSNQEQSRPVYQRCEDLQKVKGIGPQTVKNISQWLKFE